MIQYLATAPVTVSAQPQVPYHLGGWTYIDKPVYPVKINASSIQIGSNWTYVYTLSNRSSYHAYFYGEWIGSKTDYDIYVYNPLGELESIHTEAAGLPEHLGTTVDGAYFTPKYSGNYSFLIVNDARESQEAKAATFMLIEHIDCNMWHSRYLQGKVNNVHVYNTSWAYEFLTSSRHVEVKVEVPDTLDMYEARLYVMANPSRSMGTVLNGVPLAWERGLYGEKDSSGFYGGFNLDSKGFRRADATASCEYPGQDMLINFTSPYSGDTLYHLVLIAENGTGTARFMVKTDFESPIIGIQAPVERAYSYNETTISAQINDTKSSLERVLLSYTADNWKTSASVNMTASQNQPYAGMIPGQPAGSSIKYRIAAYDTAGNMAEAKGAYVVKNPTNVTFSLSNSTIYGGDNITVTGRITPSGVTVALNYSCQGTTVTRQVSADSNGFFNDGYSPNKVGQWTVSAGWRGNGTYFEGFGGPKNFTVQRTTTSVDFDVSSVAITIGGDININGATAPALRNTKVTLRFTAPDTSTVEQSVYTGSDGTFSDVFKPNLVGSWSVQASMAGDNLRYPSADGPTSFAVNDTWTNTLLSMIDQYKIYIIAIGGAIGAVIGILIFLRRRG
jgi:hypothetical protein